MGDRSAAPPLLREGGPGSMLSQDSPKGRGTDAMILVESVRLVWHDAILSFERNELEGWGVALRDLEVH